MSGVFKTYFSAIRLLFYKWQAWVFVYLCNLIFGLLIALPFSSLMDNVAGHSDAPLTGLQKFDSDFIGDVLHNFGSQLYLWWGQVTLFVGLYLLLNIFLSGGLIETYVHLFQRFSVKDFLANSAKHFWRLFRLALYFIGTTIVVFVIMWSIYSRLGLSPFEMESDSVLITRTRVMSAILIFLLAWIDLVHEYAKVKIVTQQGGGFVLPVIVRIKFFVLRHFFPIVLLFLFCALTFLLLAGVYSLLSDAISSVMTMLLVGQIYLFFRVGVRLLFTTASVDFLRSQSWAE